MPKSQLRRPLGLSETVRYVYWARLTQALIIGASVPALQPALGSMVRAAERCRLAAIWAMLCPWRGLRTRPFSQFSTVRRGMLERRDSRPALQSARCRYWFSRSANSVDIYDLRLWIYDWFALGQVMRKSNG